MAKLMRAKESYFAGDHWVRAGELLHEGDPRIVPLYVEEISSDSSEEEPKGTKGRKAKE